MTTEVTFNCVCNQTQPRDRVAIVGNIAALGEWDPENCVFLETSPTSFPSWTLTMNLPRQESIEYKFIIVQQSHIIQIKDRPINLLGQVQGPIPQFKPPQVVSVVWENLGPNKNRILKTQGKSNIILYEEMNNKQVVEQFIEDKTAVVAPAKDNGKITPGILIPQLNSLSNGRPMSSMSQSSSASNLQKKYTSSSPSEGLAPKLSFTLKQPQLVNSSPQLEPRKLNLGQVTVLSQTNERKENSGLSIQVPLSQRKVEIQKIEGIKEEEDEQLVSARQATTSQPVDSQPKQEASSPTLSHKFDKKLPERKVSIPAPAPQQKNDDMPVWDEDLLKQPQIQLDPSEPIILASFLLPYNVNRNEDGELYISKCMHNPTMLYGTLENMMQKKQFNFHWVGLMTTQSELSNEEKDYLVHKFKQMGAYPIFISVEDLEPCLLYYENILRPLFHNFKDIRDMRNDYLKYWKDYLAINQKVAQKILEVKATLNNAKTIWIHNNHLLMVPLYVKKSFEQANIGLFFHSPFPSSAHFRSHKYRFEIIKSLLHCDLVAFHLFMYARNFFKTCNRICGFEIEFRRGGFLGINFHGKHVMIRVSHIGIEERFIEELIGSKKYRTYEKKLKDELKIIGQFLQANQNSMSQSKSSEIEMNDKNNEKFKPIVMVSIDTYSYHPISGLKNKLLSYQLFLQRYPAYQNRIVLIQFVGSIVQAFEKHEDNHVNVAVIKNMRQTILGIRDQIHKEFGTQCLVLQESNPPLEKRLALWSQADIILCSSLKDGLCIPVLEYVKCRLLAGKLRNSTMICSEFAGCNEAMRGVLVYNPFSATAFLETMDKALSLTPDEKEENMKRAYEYVRRNSVTKWTEGFLKDLKLAYQPVQVSYYLGVNFSANCDGKHINRLMQEKIGLKKLNIDECANSIIKANKCAIFLEIESLPHLEFSKHSIPTNEVIEQLHGLLIDNRNTVVIMGSNSKETLENWFGRNSTNNNGNNFWLAAESGYLYRPGNKEGWQKLTELNDLSWINKVRKIMQVCTDNIDGSFIEMRQSCILWNYKNTEQEHGTMFIHGLKSQIEKVIKGTNTEIIQGNGYIEVKPLGIEKRKLINILLEKISANSPIDYLFYLGIDSSDEPVYELLKSEKVNSHYLHPECSKYICSLEKKPSEADYYIEEIDAVSILLEKIYVETKKRKKVRSFSDLTVLRNISNPLVNQKFGNTKVASIANLAQYFNAQIGLNDKSVFTNDHSSPVGSFIPRHQQRDLYKRSTRAADNLSAHPQIIEEEQSIMSSQHGDNNTDANSRIHPKKKNKFPSVEEGCKTKIGYSEFQSNKRSMVASSQEKKSSQEELKRHKTTPHKKEIINYDPYKKNSSPPAQSPVYGGGGGSSSYKSAKDQEASRGSNSQGTLRFDNNPYSGSDRENCVDLPKLVQSAMHSSLASMIQNQKASGGGLFQLSDRKLTSDFHGQEKALLDASEVFIDPQQISFKEADDQEKEIISASFKSQAVNFFMAPPIINSTSKDRKFGSMADQFKMGSHGQASSGSYGGLFSGQGIQGQDLQTSPKEKHIKKISSMNVWGATASDNQMQTLNNLQNTLLQQQQHSNDEASIQIPSSSPPVLSGQFTPNSAPNAIGIGNFTVQRTQPHSGFKLDLTQMVHNQKNQAPAQYVAKEEQKQISKMGKKSPQPSEVTKLQLLEAVGLKRQSSNVKSQNSRKEQVMKLIEDRTSHHNIHDNEELAFTDSSNSDM